MKRTTIFVPESLERDLQLCARREGKPTAAVVREALAAYVADRQASIALPSFTAAFDSGHTDTADRHDELLFRSLLPPRARKASPTHARPKRRRRAQRRR
jgi:predicted transcriptional regulator